VKGSKVSAGILMFRQRGDRVEVLLAHPGGPFWARKDKGAWTIPKGEIDADEDPFQAACREFEEETGFRPEGDPIPLGSIRQAGGKVVHAWAMEGDLDPDEVRSNMVHMEWPRGSGRSISFPEIDRCAWFDISTAKEKINPAQVDFIDRLEVVLRRRG
jgi:predicted NUDIX family NTP pyrophosphohydrolase